MTREDIDRIRAMGPRNYEEARVVYASFASAASAAMTVIGAEAVDSAIAELNEWSRHLVVASELVKLEVKRLMHEHVPPFSIQDGDPDAVRCFGVTVGRDEKEPE